MGQFRVSIARRASRTSGDFSAYAGFIGKYVRGRWHTPIDGEDITRILREAVRDGLIVPAIDRDWRGSVGVSKRYAPQTWGETYRSGGGGGVAASTPRAKTFHQSMMESMGLDADGATAYIEKYNAMVERIDAIQAANAAKRAAAAAASNDDLLGAVEAAAGAVLGGGDNAGEVSGDDAQPFDYQPDMPDGDAEQIAGMPFNGAPGTWASSMPGTMPQLRQYGSDGTPMTDIDFEAHHGNPNPHAHNWDGTSRDEGAPVSLLPW